MFLRLDAVILARVEKFCHWFQRLTGLTNFWWTRLCVTIATGASIVSVVRGCHFWQWLAWFIAIVQVVLFPATMWLSIRMQRYYAQEYTAAHPVTARYRDADYRRSINIIVYTAIVAWRCLFFDISSGMQFIFYTLIAATLESYTLGCVPLPPGTSKVREFLESLRPHSPLQPVPVRR